LAKQKPPIFGMLRRTGEVVFRMLEDVQQVTIGPWIERTIAKRNILYKYQYDIYIRVEELGYEHKTVCHAAGEYARDDDGDGFREVHVDTLEGSWSLLRSWRRPHRGISQEKLPLDLGFFEFVHNVRVRGKALLGAFIARLVSSPRIPA
jgi:transposase-like protein